MNISNSRSSKFHRFSFPTAAHSSVITCALQDSCFFFLLSAIPLRSHNHVRCHPLLFCHVFVQPNNTESAVTEGVILRKGLTWYMIMVFNAHSFCICISNKTFFICNCYVFLLVSLLGVIMNHRLNFIFVIFVLSKRGVSNTWSIRQHST
jgi:hypothetical protein